MKSDMAYLSPDYVSFQSHILFDNVKVAPNR